MQVQRSSTNSRRSLVTDLARNQSQVLSAQRLRFNVFSDEYGADLGSSDGIDADRFDPHCDHVIVSNEDTGETVATTRILHGRAASDIGGFYSEDEFELNRLKQTPGVFAELGRTCIHADYRNTSALSQLWAAVSRYMINEKVDYLIGCASISMIDGGHKAFAITRKLQADHLVAERFRVVPRRQLPHVANSNASGATSDIPPLIRAYMRLGAEVCGPPCWDPSFRCADLLVLLEVEKLTSRYARKFLRPCQATAGQRVT
ncbi:MAG: GNAT family N-acetyltransferase [Oleiphilaceae bacterium]|nr:GNAT family N-acetyltransferase [Oleiphilaceae bacterium]